MWLVALLEDTWFVAAVIGVLCLSIDAILRAKKDVRREILGGLPLMYFPVLSALITEGRFNREYLIWGVLGLLVQFLLLQIFHRFGEHLYVSWALGAVSTVIFLGLWFEKPRESQVTIVSPKKFVHAPLGWASVVVDVNPSVAPDENVQVFIHSGDLKWWPCESALKGDGSRFVSNCHFGNGNNRPGDQFKIGALYGKMPIDQWLSEPAWDAIKPPSDVENVTFQDGK